MVAKLLRILQNVCGRSNHVTRDETESRESDNIFLDFYMKVDVRWSTVPHVAHAAGTFE